MSEPTLDDLGRELYDRHRALHADVYRYRAGWSVVPEWHSLKSTDREAWAFLAQELNREATDDQAEAVASALAAYVELSRSAIPERSANWEGSV